METRYFFQFIVIISFFACGDEMQVNPDISDVVVSECLGEINLSPLSGDCSAPFLSDSLYCTPEELGTFFLSDMAKTFMKQYCYDIGVELIFKSADGETLPLLFTDKSYYRSSYTRSSNIQCESDTSKNRAFCLVRDLIEIEFTEPQSGNNILMRLSTVPVFNDTELLGTGEELGVFTKVSSSPFGVLELLALVQSDAPANNLVLHRFHQELELNGQIYSDVYASISLQNTQSKYYVNDQLGLFAITWEDGKTYVLE